MPKSGRGQAEERGDLYAIIEVQLPTNLSAEEKALFEQLRTMRGYRVTVFVTRYWVGGSSTSLITNNQ
jgi:DnaJ-class molecular chaperone